VIVYLHGLNSAGTSAKAAWLRKHLPDVAVLSPTYAAHDGNRAPEWLSDFIAQARAAHPGDARLLLVGSSLGGFWAQYLAPRLGAGMVLINPALLPDESLARFCGPQRNDASRSRHPASRGTGTSLYVAGEQHELTHEDLQALARFRLSGCVPHVPTLVLLDAADEVIDYRVAEFFYRGCGTTIVYPGGSHRFDHLPEALPAIRRLYDAL
jgi:predicted esterase YcpF (UPF0227 family)